MPRKSNNKPTGMFAEMAKVKAKQQSDSVIGAIQTHLLKKAANNDRRQDVIHPSELCKDDVCGRQIVYRISGVEEDFPKPPNGAQLELIFQEGHSVHAKYQNLLMEMGVLFGKWKCQSCGHVVFDTLSSDLEEFGEYFEPIHTHVWEYQEVPVDAYDELRMFGHEDGAVGKSLIEVKTIGLGTLRMEEPELVKKYTVRTEDGKSIVDVDALWKALNRPLKSHKIQAGIYLWVLVNLRGYDFEDIVFVYEYKPTQLVKEFRVKLDESLVLPKIELAKAIKNAVDSKSQLPRPDWAKQDGKTCSGCQFRSRCWSDESPSLEKLGDEETESSNGSSKSRSQEEAGDSGDTPTRAAGLRRSPSPTRSNSTERPRATRPVRPVANVERASGDAAHYSRGRRTVRRSQA